MKTRSSNGILRSYVVALVAVGISCAWTSRAADNATGQAPPKYEYKETQDLVALVTDAAKLVEAKGEQAFAELRQTDSRWRKGETYVFVLDGRGRMLVHPDPALEGKDTSDLKDVNGRAITKGLLYAATAIPGKPEGWYHYEWPVPQGLLPRWKSSYVRMVVAPSDKVYVVGSGVYNDRMERAFVVDMVRNAVGQIEAEGTTAFPMLREPTGPYFVKDAYIFVIDPRGVELVNPGFPSVEGRNLMDLKDTQGKVVIREMLDVVQSAGSGWVDYMWPKPGESDSTQKSAYVSKAKITGCWVLVGAGVYLADAPHAARDTKAMRAPQLVSLVREAAELLEKRGEASFDEFRVKGSKWFRDDTYVFVWSMNGIRVLNAANAALEGMDVSEIKDVRGRPFGRMFMETAASPAGEGWVHYMYPEPGSIFPAWKSSFVKRVTTPSGKPYLIGAGVYNMQMDKTLVKDLVDRAADVVAKRGRDGFGALRDKTGPFVFMDTYVFVNGMDGSELVNAAQPSLEGTNLMDVKDLKGKTLVRDYIEGVSKSKDGAVWTEYYWYKPGSNTPCRKVSYVRMVQSGGEKFVVGSGFYPEEE
jgi:signal transduction histidine kinase